MTLLAACAPEPPRSGTEPAAPAPAAPAPPPAATPAAPSTEGRAPEPSGNFTQRGRVSMYGDGDGFDGKTTASGEPFDADALTMAHRTLPFGTRVRVTNLENHKSVEVVVNDRGPRVRDRIADLSAAAAKRLGMVSNGVVEALLEVVEPSKRR